MTRAERRDDAWTPRPLWARVVCVFAASAPVLVGAAAAIALSRWLPTTSTLAGTCSACCSSSPRRPRPSSSSIRGARRLLPLAALYRLSLVFPDHAPSRFRTALKAGSSRRVERLVEETRLHGLPTDAGEAGPAGRRAHHRDRRSRSPHAWALRTRSPLRGPDRRRAAPVEARAAEAAMGRVAARPRQADRARRDPQQEGCAERRRVAHPAHAPGGRRTARPAAARVPRHVGRRGRRPSRMVERHRIPAAVARRPDQPVGRDRRGGRRVRSDDRGPLVQEVDAGERGARRTRTRRRRAVLARGRARVLVRVARQAPLGRRARGVARADPVPRRARCASPPRSAPRSRAAAASRPRPGRASPRSWSRPPRWRRRSSRTPRPHHAHKAKTVRVRRGRVEHAGRGHAPTTTAAGIAGRGRRPQRADDTGTGATTSTTVETSDGPALERRRRHRRDPNDGSADDNTAAADPNTRRPTRSCPIPVVRRPVKISIGDVSTPEGDDGTRVMSFPVTLSATDRHRGDGAVLGDGADRDGRREGRRHAGAEVKVKSGTLTFDPTATGRDAGR